MATNPTLPEFLHLISSPIGRQLAYEISTHDDGIAATGGTMTGIVGRHGSGKSTFLIQLDEAATYLPPPLDKYTAKHARGIPETVIRRGLRDDNWNCLIPENFAASFPDAPYIKPIRVHIYHEDNTAFYEERCGKKYRVMFKPLEEICRYFSTEDLYDNLLRGGINIVFEPKKYFLTAEMLDRILATRITNQKKAPVGQVRAPSSVWWFEFFETYIRQKHREESVVIDLDEGHQVFPRSSKGDHWQLIDWMSENLVSFRKHGMSLNIGTQDINDIDWRIRDRLGYFIWLRGSRPISRISMVSPKMIGKLPRGWAILEESRARFGKMPFSRIPNQPPIIQAIDTPLNDREDYRCTSSPP